VRIDPVLFVANLAGDSVVSFTDPSLQVANTA